MPVAQTALAPLDRSDARITFEAHVQRSQGLSDLPARVGDNYSVGAIQDAWETFQSGIAFAQQAQAVSPPSDQDIIDCFTKAGVWLGVAPDEVARNVQAVKFALEQFAAPVPAEMDPARADERVPGIGHPTTYRDLGRLSAVQLWNRWYAQDRFVNARDAFIAARAIPFVAGEYVARDAARYKEVRERAYNYGVGNPSPSQLDVLVDAAIAARTSAQSK